MKIQKLIQIVKDLLGKILPKNASAKPAATRTAPLQIELTPNRPFREKLSAHTKVIRHQTGRAVGNIRSRNRLSIFQKLA